MRVHLPAAYTRSPHGMEKPAPGMGDAGSAADAFDAKGAPRMGIAAVGDRTRLRGRRARSQAPRSTSSVPSRWWVGAVCCSGHLAHGRSPSDCGCRRGGNIGHHVAACGEIVVFCSETRAGRHQIAADKMCRSRLNPALATTDSSKHPSSAVGSTQQPPGHGECGTVL